MKNNIKVKNAIDNLLKMFESGELPEAVTRTIIERKKGDWQPSYNWSLGNNILMYSQDTIDARGYKQWQKVGRYVKKGSKAIQILAPMSKKIIEETEEGEEVEKYIILGFRTIPVFKYEDTEGEEIDRPDYKPMELPPLWKVAEKLNLEVEYTPFMGDAYGSFNLKNKIRLHTHDYKTFYHELAHAVHGTIRKLKGGQQPEQEIVAETVALVLLEMQGIKGFEYHGYKYIKWYTGQMKEKEVLKGIMKVLSEIEEVLNIILNIADEINVEVENNIA